MPHWPRPEGDAAVAQHRHAHVQRRTGYVSPIEHSSGWQFSLWSYRKPVWRCVPQDITARATYVAPSNQDQGTVVLSRTIACALSCIAVLALPGCNTYRRESIVVPISDSGPTRPLSAVSTHAVDAGDMPPQALQDLRLPGRTVARTESPELLVTYRSKPSVVRRRSVQITSDSGGNTAYMVSYVVASASTLVVEAPAYAVHDTLVSNREDIYEVGSRYDRNVLLGGKHNGSVPRRGVVVMTSPADVSRYESHDEAATVSGIMANPSSASDVVMEFNGKYGPARTSAHMAMVSSTEDDFTQNIAKAVEMATTADAITTLIQQVQARRDKAAAGSDDWGMYTIALGVLRLKNGEDAEAATLFASVADPHDFVGRMADDNVAFMRLYRVKR